MSEDDDEITPEKAERLRQRMASLDGKTGRGGCEFCDSTYEFVTIALGESELRIFHEPDCDRQLQWLISLNQHRR